MRESGENYLETIYNLEKKNGTVRSVDIARELGYTKPSVSRAVKLLKEQGMLTVEGGGKLQLTPQGLELAESVSLRHQVIMDYLIQTLHIDRDTADKDACRIEHVISQETFLSMKKFTDKFKKMFES